MFNSQRIIVIYDKIKNNLYISFKKHKADNRYYKKKRKLSK